jgi:pimeloyl-ACP methyl ester carboxylesterase
MSKLVAFFFSTGVWIAVVAAVAAAPVLGQDSRPAAPEELRRAVEAYFGEASESAAAKLLEQLVTRADATAENVLAAVGASNAPLAASMDFNVPYRDQLLAATVRVPEGHSRSGPRLPVVFDVSGGAAADWLKLGNDAIVVFVKGYTPPEFSDEGRDGFLKVLRSAAHRAHGDPGRLWLCGFSWAGHASWDVALHRPGVLRGIVPMGGGPRRTWFRLLPQLLDTKVLAFCGEKDDPELVWNLREVQSLAPRLKLSHALVLDAEQGHSLPLKGLDGVAAAVRETPALDLAGPLAGTLLADAPLVESPLLRIDAVDDKRVLVPARVPVDASLSPDGQRRATIAAMAGKVAKLSWRIERKADETGIALAPEGVTAVTVFLREPLFQHGRKASIHAQGQKASARVLLADPRAVLADARRTGDRLRPPLRFVIVRF